VIRKHDVTAAAIALAAAGTSACGASPGATMAANVETARSEQTPEKLVERGRAFANVGDYTRAEQYLAAALDAGAPAKVVLPILLKTCVAENRFRAAIAYAEPHLKTQPDDFRLRFVVASLYASIGETEAALSHLSRVASTKPDYAEVQYAMAVLLRDAQRDLVQADVHFREYLRLEPNGRHAAEARGSLLRTLAPASDPSAPRPPDAPGAVNADPKTERPEGIWKTVP
jgi:tetratricopeptide (TPR) repeat protein